MYQVQTNLFVQPYKLLIWITGSTSKRHGGMGNFTLNRSPLITLLQIHLTRLLCILLDVDPVAQIRSLRGSIKILVCT